MTEATGYEAKTIHRLLEVSGGIEEGSSSHFEKNEENPIEADVVILDEMSMVDIHLMYSLLKAIVPGNKAHTCRGFKSASKCRTGKRFEGYY